MKKFISILRILATFFSTLSVVFGLCYFFNDMISVKIMIQELWIPTMSLGLYLITLLFIWTTGTKNEKNHH